MYCADEHYHRVYLKNDETHALQFINKNEKLYLRDYEGGKLIRDNVLYGMGLASLDKLSMPLQCWQFGKYGKHVYNDRVREIRVAKCNAFYLNACLDFPNLSDIFIDCGILYINDSVCICSDIPPMLHIPYNSAIFFVNSVERFDDEGYATFTGEMNIRTRQWRNLYKGKMKLRTMVLKLVKRFLI